MEVITPQNASRLAEHILLQPHEGPTYSMAFSPDGGTLAVDSNNRVELWRIADGAARDPAGRLAGSGGAGLFGRRGGRGRRQWQRRPVLFVECRSPNLAEAGERPAGTPTRLRRDDALGAHPRDGRVRWPGPPLGLGWEQPGGALSTARPHDFRLKSGVFGRRAGAGVGGQ
jgi:WD40 repeat protein